MSSDKPVHNAAWMANTVAITHHGRVPVPNPMTSRACAVAKKIHTTEAVAIVLALCAIREDNIGTICRQQSRGETHRFAVMSLRSTAPFSWSRREFPLALTARVSTLMN